MELGERLALGIEAATFERVADIGFRNAELNAPHIKRSVLELAKTPLGSGESAVVVGAGPSLHRRRSLQRLRASSFTGTIVAADGALGACLKAGVVPHLVVSVDPHGERIVRWFGDPTPTAPREDGHLRRQELDPAHHDAQPGPNPRVQANPTLARLV